MRFDYKLKSVVVFLVVIISLIMFIVFREVIGVFSIICLLIILFVFFGVDIIFNLKFKKRHYFFVIFIVVVGFLFSFIQFRYIYVDKILHFIGAIMLSFVLYFMLRKRLSKKHSLVFVFFITIGIIVFYEFFEYFMDTLFNMRFQGVFLDTEGGQVIMGKVEDTFWDIFLGVFGSLVYVFISMFRKN